jgi:ABC-type dipeptide/oligopeptide/nickel transport system ATPase component
VLLVDEPTYGQDKEMTYTLMALMRDIRQRGVAVVMITHDMRLVQEYAERVVVMSEGCILLDAPSSELFEQNAVLEQANLRRTILHDLLRAMSERGAPVEGRVRHTTDVVNLLKLKQGA